MKRWMAVVLISLGFAVAAKADETGTSWRRVDDGAADRFSSVSWDGPVAVAVGPRGLLGTSTDGKSWTIRFQGAQADLKGVAWNGSHHVAVGSGGTILRSANGTDWQRIDAPADKDYAGVTWTGTQFIALDNGFYLSTSADGITWNRFAILPPNNCSGIDHFDGATYLRNGFGICRSTDLVTWTQVLDMSNNNTPAVIRKLNGKLFTVGPRDNIRSSSNGVTWTPASLNGVTFPPQDLRDIAWSGTCYLAVGASNRVWRSLDGQAWTTENAVAGDPAFVRWINGEFVTVGPARGIQTSPDGSEWTTARINIYTPGNATVWTGSRYITVGNYGYIATSSDYESWTSRDSGIFTNLQSVVWTGSFALASGANGVVLKSDDGLVWTQVAASTFAGSTRVVWTGTQLFAFSDSGTDTSSGGTSWTRISTAVPSQLNDVKWVRDRFIGVGFTGGIYTSPDGVVWTPRESGTTTNLYAAGASDSEFLIGGQNGILLASPDGVVWTPRIFPAVAIGALDYRFGRWILATAKGIYRSVDGIAWSTVPDVAGTSILADQAELVWTGTELVCTGLNAKTSDGINWQQLEMRRAVPDFSAVAKGAGGYVAVGSAGVIWRSADGYSWQQVASPTTASLVALAARPGRWVAVGSGGVIVSSPDGIQWTLENSGTVKALRDIAWNGQRFAASGEGGTILTSINGQSWSAQTTGSTGDLLNIEAMGLAFKAFAGGGNVVESPDGITWALTTPGWIADVVWNGTSYVGVASGPGGTAWAHISSPDALQWTRYPIGVNSFLTGICWSGTQHVACGTNGKIVTSPDAITWTPRESGTTQWIQAIVWNGTQLVAVGQGGILLYSPDGITWTKGTKSGAVYDYEDVAWADGRYVAVGNNGASATSTDGMTWQSMTGSIGTSKTVEKIGTRFLAGGDSLVSATSTHWVSATNSGFPATLYDFETNGTQLFAATTNGVYLLTENTAGKWNTATRVHVSPWLDNMARNGGEFVATGALGTIVLSRDGTSWQTVKGGRDEAFVGTASNGNRFVGVGSNRILVSPDGSAWNAPVSPVGTAGFSLAEVIWTGSRFLAVGFGRVFRASPDGVTWTSIGSTAESPTDATSFAGDDELLVAVGSGGMIAVSDGSGDAANDYHVWMSGQGADSDRDAPLQDANADGISNLMAYIHGIPATGSLTPSQRAALPTLSFDPGSGGSVITFELRESYRPGATYAVEVSRDMQPGTWQSRQRYSAGWASGPDQATVTESPLPGGGIRITISGFPEIDGSASCFFRLKVLLP